jgi:hypothetical protein
MVAAEASVALVTPTYAPDYEFCRLLSRSVREFLPGSVHHYLVVQHDDLPLFQRLANDRTTVLSQREFLPRSFRRLPGTPFARPARRSRARYVASATFRPFGGWLIQQVVKLSIAEALDADCVVCVDSDVTFVRDVDLSLFVRDGRTRFFRKPDGITAAMERHVSWQANAASMLGLAPGPVPGPDYISSMVAWDKQVIKEMRERVERTTGRSLPEAVVRAHAFSEYLLYGTYVDRVLGDQAPVFVEPSSGCHSYWEAEPLTPGRKDAFVRAFGATDVAVHLQSVSGTDADVRQSVIATLSGGRLFSAT